MKILMCDPKHYLVSYSINPWMDVKNRVIPDLAKKQWKDLVKIIEKLAEVKVMSGVEGLPDLVFTANAATMFENTALLSNFRHPERQPEKQVYEQWFLENGYDCDSPDEIFEGAGDCLVEDKEIYFGYGFRSKFFDLSKWSSLPVRPLLLNDPYFYHLDTCFCPLPNDYLMLYSAAFYDCDLFYDLACYSHKKLIEVPLVEAMKFACNAVSIDKNVIIPSGCPETRQLLEENGFTVYDTDMSEYIKAGGACRCLSIKI